MHVDATVLAVSNILVEVHDAETGELLAEQAHHNLAVDAGLDLLCSYLAGSAPAGITHFAVGTGSTAVAAGQTALVTEVLREAITEAITASKSVTIKYYLASGSANGSTLAEIGLFNHASAGTMFARALLSPTIAKTTAIAVTFTWTVSFAAS